MKPQSLHLVLLVSIILLLAATVSADGTSPALDKLAREYSEHFSRSNVDEKAKMNAAMLRHDINILVEKIIASTDDDATKYSPEVRASAKVYSTAANTMEEQQNPHYPRNEMGRLTTLLANEADSLTPERRAEIETEISILEVFANYNFMAAFFANPIVAGFGAIVGTVAFLAIMKYLW